MEPISVSEFVHAVSDFLEQGLGTVAVKGEVTGFRINRDRLVYFELKDKESRVLCFMLKWELKALIEDGMEVKVMGTPKLFVGSGQFHLKVISVEPFGQGALQRAYELLKAKLTAEGLFAPERKRDTPRFPATIGIVTSPDAAAFTDVVHILQNRWAGLRIVLASAGVQGIGAVSEIVASIRYLNTVTKPDVIIVTRGGGSLEDLQAFNSEEVCRAIFASQIPVVAAIGHERDTTLAELVADVRASTPSNAAELVVPDKQEVNREISSFLSALEQDLRTIVVDRAHRVDNLAFGLIAAFRDRLESARHLVQRFTLAFVDFRAKVVARRTRIEVDQGALSLRFDFFLLDLARRLDERTKLLETLSPTATLNRGYSITLKEDRVIRDVSLLDPGDEVQTRLARGEFTSTVSGVE